MTEWASNIATQIVLAAHELAMRWARVTEEIRGGASRHVYGKLLILSTLLLEFLRVWYR
jgi:hypothetical protein